MIVPISIPDGEIAASSELAVFPNKRRFRRFLVSHVLDKLLTDNATYRNHIARKISSNPEGHVVKLAAR